METNDKLLHTTRGFELVFSLPIRDGNFDALDRVSKWKLVFSLPIRDGNEFVMKLTEQMEQRF